jgi:glycosidase
MVGLATAEDFRAAWSAATYSFPRGALRMRWLEEKEQGRAHRYYGREGHFAAASVLLTLDGVPFLLMGQEFNETLWVNWQSLFEDFRLDWQHFDTPTFHHYQILIHLRKSHLALRRGTVEFLPAPRGILRYARVCGNEQVVVTVNLTAHVQYFPVETEAMHTIYRFNPDGTLRMSEIGAFGCVIQVRI